MANLLMAVRQPKYYQRQWK